MPAASKPTVECRGSRAAGSLAGVGFVTAGSGLCLCGSHSATRQVAHFGPAGRRSLRRPAEALSYMEER